MYKAVLFDMDGTVLNTVEDLTDSMNHSLNKYGFPSRTSDEVKSFLGKGPAHFVSCAVPAGTAEAVKRELQVYYEEYYDTHCQIKTAPYEGITELLQTLKDKGLRLAVISNKQDPAVQALAQRHFKGLIELAVGTGANVPCKPDPTAVLKAMEQLGVSKSETVYVGDMDVDMNTAKNAGIDCISVSWGFLGRERLEALGAKLIVDDTRELLGEIVNRQ